MRQNFTPVTVLLRFTILQVIYLQGSVQNWWSWHESISHNICATIKWNCLVCHCECHTALNDGKTYTCIICNSHIIIWPNKVWKKKHDLVITHIWYLKSDMKLPTKSLSTRTHIRIETFGCYSIFSLGGRVCIAILNFLEESSGKCMANS